MADKVFKPEDLLGKSPAEVDALKAAAGRDTTSRSVAINLASLNPKIDPRIVIGAAKSAVSGSLPAKKSDPKTGRSYFDYGGAQIFVD